MTTVVAFSYNYTSTGSTNLFYVFSGTDLRSATTSALQDEEEANGGRKMAAYQMSKNISTVVIS